MVDTLISKNTLNTLPERPQEFYISDILGKKICDSSGRTVGRVRDLVARWPGGYPQVVGIMCTRDTRIIPMDQVAELNAQGVFLCTQMNLVKDKPIAEDEIYVNRWLLDKQIVDIKGAKVVRVNDIKLRWQRKDGTLIVYLVAVDIGSRGLIRRLGVRRLGGMFKEQHLDWQHFKPMENRAGNLQLVVSRKDLSHLHPADIADILEDLNRHGQTELLRHLDRETAVEALAEVDSETRTYLFESMDSAEASALVQAMAPDEAADVLGDLSENKSAAILELMQPEEALEVKELMEYSEGTAGSLMTTEVVALTSSLTAQQAIDRLREMAPSAETIYYIYVVDEAEQLLGVLSLRELIIVPPGTLLETIMHPNVVTLNPQDDYEQILDITIKYNLLAVPVVNREDKLLGIITVDDVLEMVQPENKANILGILRALTKR